ncbi:MAG: S46 family peptidase [Bacteroidales bacterium]|nr:S46 family peptidase [Bacteroidales bacterium]MDY5781965.1 S46 family peptidase [Candidatus Cryptobacteroides sp.]
MKKFLCTLSALLLITAGAWADEGMWLLPLIQKMNGKAMKDLGCRLTPEEIYSINNNSLKDAIVQFGGGCTGEIISDKGLLVTNHHCGYSSIQGLSTPEHNYLEDGYWAMSNKDELPVKGLTVKFLQSMTDVTPVLEKAREAALKEYKDSANVNDLADNAVKAAREGLIKSAEADHPNCDVRITGFYNENVYYLIVYKIYRDVRFVGAPPASVGKFGGETDNWMWPRHTGDFSMFRVYAGKDNEPADYSEDNVPYVPKQSLKVSLKGINEGDYAMVMGYPGRTQRFQTASQLNQMLARQDISVAARTLKQSVMKEGMEADPTVRLQYANKYASSANGWKKWIGEKQAFAKLNIIGREEAKEAAFTKWVGANKKRTEAYGDALSMISEAVDSTTEGLKALYLLIEAPFNVGAAEVGMSWMMAFTNSLSAAPSDTAGAYEAARTAVLAAFKDYNEPLERKIAAAMLDFYRKNAKPENYLNITGFDFATMDIQEYVDWLFDNSIFSSEEKFNAAGDIAVQTVAADPAYAYYNALMDVYMKVLPIQRKWAPQLSEGSRKFAAGLLEWEKGKPSYPDANSTMRLSYGTVKAYSPADGILYRYYTTLNGVMEKEDPENYEFKVPAKLKELYNARDFGQYAGPDGMVPTCFLTTNDITGGNSGSPVLDADGCLIGLAFDGNWESMSSDVMFEPDLQRCICVDIRYVLFLMDKLGGAGHLLKEMNIVR